MPEQPDPEGAPSVPPVLKIAEPKAHAENPWGDDVLERQEIADRLTTIVRGQEAPFVVSIDGRWGTGKTFLLTRWRQDLENHGWRAIYFNAWEDDFNDDPLLAIIGQLSEYFGEGPLREAARAVAGALGHVLVRRVTGASPDDLTLDSLLNDYREGLRTKSAVKNRLEQLGMQVHCDTGQPLLQAMYVDKRLDGVQAVQTLSRLNRIAPGKAPPFVLDFVNDAEGIRAAFAPYYDRTELRAASDPYRLQQLKHELDGMQVYHHAEVEAFAKAFYLPRAKRRPGDHARMEAQLQPSRDRFRALAEDGQTAFRDRLGAFVGLYAFLTQIIPYGDGDLERLGSFGRALLPHLKTDRDDDAVHIGGDVELEYYRLQRVSSGAVAIGEDGDVHVTTPTEVATGDPGEVRAPLSEIIDRLNDRFGTDFTEEDRLFFAQVKERAVSDEEVRNLARANPFDKFALGVRDRIGELMMERMKGNDAIVTRFLDDTEFQEIAADVLAREIFAEVGAAG